MFGNRFFNKIVKSDGNVQVSGDVGKIEIGLKSEDIRLTLEAFASEIRKDQQEIRRISEESLKSDLVSAENRINEQQKHINKLKEIIGDPQKYIEYTEDARSKIATLLNNLESADIYHNMEEIRREIKVGSLSNAERLLENLEALPSMNTKLKAQTVSVRATLAFLDLQFDKSEALSRRAFYIEPNINTLVVLLDQLDMNGERTKLLATLKEAKAALPDGDVYANARLIAIEAWSSAMAGDIEGAKASIKVGDAALRHLPPGGNEAAVQIAVCKASIAVYEGKQSAALKHFRQALKWLQEEEEEDGVFIARIEANIGACLAELGHLDEAITITRACIERLRTEGNAGKYHLGIRLNNLGDFLTRDDKAEEAIEVLRESIELATNTLPENHPSLVRRRLNLAIALRQVGRREEAIRELLSIEVDEAAFGEFDKRSFVKSKSILFDYCIESQRWLDALSAALTIQRIGAEYLADRQIAAALPRAISALRHAILSRDYSRLNQQRMIGVSRGSVNSRDLTG